MLGVDISFGRSRVVRRPFDYCRSTTHLLWKFLVEIINSRPDGVNRGKRRTVGWEGWGEYCGNLTPLRLLPPSVLVKDRGVDICEQVLNVLIACWRYGPSKLSSLMSTNLWLPCFNGCLGERNWLGTHRSFSRRAVDWDMRFFLGGSEYIQTFWWLHERLSYEMCMTYWSCFSYRMYINSNHRDSRIWVTTCLVIAIK
jgi:hypothetical protein